MASVTYEQAGGAPDTGAAAPPKSVSYEDAGGPSAGTAIGYSIAHALPYANQIGAAIETGEEYLPKWLRAPGDAPVEGATYAQNLARIRDTSQDVERAYPLTSTVVPLATAAAALPFAGPAEAVGGLAARVLPSAAARAIGAGTVGAGYGALYGSETGGAKGAGWGAVTGGLGGAAAEPIAGVLGRGVKGVGDWLGLYDPVAEGGRRVSGAVAKDAASPNMSPAELNAAHAAGQPAVAGDLGGENVRGLARATADLSPSARATLVDPLQDRYLKQGDRVSNFVANMFGGNLDSQAARDAIAARSQATSGPAYARAYQAGANGVWNSDLQNLMRSPGVRSVLGDAQRKAEEWAVANRQPLPANPFRWDANGNMALARDVNGNARYPTLQYWDQVKRSLQGKESSAFASGDKESVKDWGNLKRTLTGYLDQAVPEYATARAGAFRSFQAEDALEAGENFLNAKGQKLDAMKQQLAGMNPADRETFAQGLASQIAQKAKSTPDTADLVKKFNSQDIRDKLALGLGPQRGGQLGDFLAREDKMNLLRNEVMGSSKTARYEAGKAAESPTHGGLVHSIASQFTGPAAGAIGGGFAGFEAPGGETWHDKLRNVALGAAGGAALGTIRGRQTAASEAMRSNIASRLVNPNPQALQSSVQTIRASPVLREIMQRGAAYSGRPAGWLFGGR